MKAVQTLPEGYWEIYSCDLKQDKKLALLVNGIALAITVALLLLGRCFVPLWELSSLFRHKGMLPVLLAIFGSLVAYIILHEAVHGLAMKIVGTTKVRYGFTGAYAYAGSDDYYNKKAYIFIALAPVVLWGVVLAVACALVPTQWFWVIYFVQLQNLGGAAGDFYVTVKFSRFSKDILVRDYGVGMKVFDKKQL